MTILLTTEGKRLAELGTHLPDADACGGLAQTCNRLCASIALTYTLL